MPTKSKLFLLKCNMNLTGSWKDELRLCSTSAGTDKHAQIIVTREQFRNSSQASACLSGLLWETDKTGKTSHRIFKPDCQIPWRRSENIYATEIRQANAARSLEHLRRRHFSSRSGWLQLSISCYDPLNAWKVPQRFCTCHCKVSSAGDREGVPPKETSGINIRLCSQVPMETE